MLVILGKAQIIAKQDKPRRGPAQNRQQPLDRRQILAAQLHDLQIMPLGPNRRMHRLDQ